MRKRLKTRVLILLAVLALSGCSAKQVQEENSGSTDVQISSELSESSVETEKTTAEVPEETGEPGDITGQGIYVDNENTQFTTQGTYGLPIVISLQDDEESATVQVRFGRVRIETEQSAQWLTDEDQVGNGETVWWYQQGPVGENYFVQVYSGSVYGDIIIRKGEQIVGYAVLELTVKGNGQSVGEVIREVRFQQEEGADPQITEEELVHEIEQVILERAGQVETIDTIAARPAIGTGEGVETSAAEALTGQEADETFISTPATWDVNVDGSKRKLTVSSDDPEVEFYLTVDKGSLELDSEDGRKTGDGRLEAAVLQNGDSAFYSNGWKDSRYTVSWRGTYDYINIIMKKADQIIGYAVVELAFPDSDNRGYSELKQIVQIKFPRIDGQYQNVPENYVWQQIHAQKERDE